MGSIIKIVIYSITKSSFCDIIKWWKYEYMCTVHLSLKWPWCMLDNHYEITFKSDNKRPGTPLYFLNGWRVTCNLAHKLMLTSAIVSSDLGDSTVLPFPISKSVPPANILLQDIPNRELWEKNWTVGQNCCSYKNSAVEEQGRRERIQEYLEKKM